MVIQTYQEGTVILRRGHVCDKLMFIVNGIAELGVDDAFGEYHVFEDLRQGDCIGQYSVLFEEPLMFNIKAGTSLRVLTLDMKFFKECSKDRMSA